MKRHSAFTLLELLVVVAIITVLAAIAVPNALEAKTRSNVALAKSNGRTVTNAISTYRVDWGAYPPGRAVIPSDPLGLLATSQLTLLTTPTAYVSAPAFVDPFGHSQGRFISTFRSSTPSEKTDFPIPTLGNPQRSSVYISYPWFASLTGNPLIAVEGSAVISIGPDQSDSFGAFYPFDAKALPRLAGFFGVNTPVDSLYDPTNGTLSGGDIPSFVGALRVQGTP